MKFFTFERMACVFIAIAVAVFAFSGMRDMAALFTGSLLVMIGAAFKR